MAIQKKAVKAPNKGGGWNKDMRGGKRSEAAIAKAKETLRQRREVNQAFVELSISRGVADQLRAALGVDPTAARAALNLRVGERMIWETTAKEFRAEMTRLKLRASPTVQAMRFEVVDATTFVNAALAFETCLIRRVE